jgi:hypothetical protein
LTRNPWASLPSTTIPTYLSPTAEIDPLLVYLRTSLTFLSRALAPAPLRRVARSLLATISTFLWENVLSRYRFSTQGAAQLHADLGAICRVVNKSVGEGVAEAGLGRCIEGVGIVGLPVRGRNSVREHGDDGSEEEGENWDEGAWGGDVDADGEGHGKAHHSESSSAEKKDLGLWEVERRLFADNQSARDVLEELGLELLSETEARALLRRRVELAG